MDGDTVYFDCTDFPLLDENDVQAIDNCGTTSVVFEDYLTYTSPDCSTSDFKEVFYCAWFAEDNCGNRDTLEFYAVIQDNEAPLLLGVPNNVQVECNTNVAIATVNAVDNCDGIFAPDFLEVVLEEGCSRRVQRIWTAIDSCGNVAEASQIITYVDTTAPVFIGLPNESNVSIDCGQPLPSIPVVSAIDDCSGEAFTPIFTESENYDGDCLISVERKWEASDACGNSAQYIQTIQIIDNIPPVFTSTPSSSMIMTYDEFRDWTPPTNLEATDNCSTPTISVPIVTDNGDCDNREYYYTWTATDACGNSNDFTMTIVLDRIGAICYISTTPEIFCGVSNIDFTAHAYLGLPPYEYSWAIVQGDGYAFESANDSKTVTLSSGTGVLELEVTVTDMNGCSSTCNIIKTCIVEDGIYCALTPEDYGDPNGLFNGNSHIALIDSFIQMDYNGDGAMDNLVLGLPGQSLIFDGNDIMCISSLLPASTTTNAVLPMGDLDVVGCDLPGIALDANGQLENQLLARAITLKLNLRLDLGYRYLLLTDVCTQLPQSIYDKLGTGATVETLSELADEALGGADISPVTLDELSTAINTVTVQFVDCKPACNGGIIAPVNPGRLQVMPNPATDRIDLLIKADEAGQITVEVFDMLGRKLIDRNNKVVIGQNRMFLDITELSAAPYIVVVKIGRRKLAKKFFKIEE